MSKFKVGDIVRYKKDYPLTAHFERDKNYKVIGILQQYNDVFLQFDFDFYKGSRDGWSPRRFELVRQIKFLLRRPYEQI